VFNIFKV